MTDKLKPCPFCGGEAHLQPFMGYWTVGCTDCFGAVVGKIGTKEEAIKEWNKRSNWHTGTPTEEGWYLQCIKSKNEISYDTDYYENGDWKYFCIFREIVAWQKIEPFKETE